MNASTLPKSMLDADGQCQPWFMTDGEISAELDAGTGREAELKAERRTRRDQRRAARAAAVAHVATCQARGVSRGRSA
jgi:hypothetical protein